LVQGQDLYIYHNDPNGCPTRLLDTDGNVVWAARYDALGSIVSLPANRVDNPIRMQGQYFDSETGLYYNRFRYFEPMLGAFISQDPLGLVAGENVYAVAPNVLGWVDPLGLSCKKVPKTKTPKTNAQLVQEIATRAERKIGGTGRVAGTKKHAYAKKLLDRYQKRHGDRGLRTETTWYNHAPAKYGTKGSTRIDVFDKNTGAVYDYKFTTRPGQGLSRSQVNKITNHGPLNITSVTEVNP